MRILTPTKRSVALVLLTFLLFGCAHLNAEDKLLLIKSDTAGCKANNCCIYVSEHVWICDSTVITLDEQQTSITIRYKY